MHYEKHHPEWEWLAKVPVPLYWLVKTILTLIIFYHTGHI